MTDYAAFGDNREDSVAPSIAPIGENQAIVPPALRRTIIRIFNKQYGLTLHASAVAFIHSTLESHGLLEYPSQWSEANSFGDGWIPHPIPPPSLFIQPPPHCYYYTNTLSLSLSLSIPLLYYTNMVLLILPLYYCGQT